MPLYFPISGASTTRSSSDTTRTTSARAGACRTAAGRRCAREHFRTKLHVEKIELPFLNDFYAAIVERGIYHGFFIPLSQYTVYKEVREKWEKQYLEYVPVGWCFF